MKEGLLTSTISQELVLAPRGREFLFPSPHEPHPTGKWGNMILLHIYNLHIPINSPSQLSMQRSTCGSAMSCSTDSLWISNLCSPHAVFTRSSLILWNAINLRQSSPTRAFVPSCTSSRSKYAILSIWLTAVEDLTRLGFGRAEWVIAMTFSLRVQDWTEGKVGFGCRW